MSGYRPKSTFTTPIMLLIPTYQKINGVRTKIYPEVKDGVLFFGSFKTYGGTERDVNGVFSIEDTADVQTWYNPEIKSDCLIAIADTGAKYDIISEPENIEMRNQFMKFKVRRTKGGV